MAETAARVPVRSWGSGTAAIARLLIGASEPLTGVAIAKATAVTQPQASQVLKQFGDREAVSIQAPATWENESSFSTSTKLGRGPL